MNDGISKQDVHERKQCMTPGWAAIPLVELFGVYPHDRVLEASAGTGSFLAAIPDHIEAIGVEIDARLAVIAHQRTGREIIIGDFRHVPIDFEPTAIVGNPPFDLDIIDAFLDRAYTLLPEGGRIGWVLPAYAFQTAGRVVRYNERFAISQTLIPRNIWEGLRLPLVFSIFTKDRQRALIGFALYRETTEIKALPARFRDILESTDGPVWLKLVTKALAALNGRASVEEIFRLVEPEAPRSNSYPRQSVRKTLLQYFDRVGEGVYAFPRAA